METKILTTINDLKSGETMKFTALVADVTASAENGRICLSIHFLTENESFKVMSFIAKNSKNIEQIRSKYSGKVACVTAERDASTGQLRVVHLALATNPDATPFLPGINRINLLENKSSSVIGALITGVEEKKARNGSIYSSISFSDGNESRSMTCFATKTSEEIELYQSKYVGKVAIILVYCDNKEKGYYRVEQIFTTVDNVDRSKFIQSTPISAEKMYDEITDTLRDFCDKNVLSIAEIAYSIYEQNKDQLLWASAAMKMHHETVGGLLYHVYRMLQLAEKFCEVYPLDKELLMVGVTLHDIGKLRELNTDESGKTTYTIDGTLFGHPLLGCDMITEEYLRCTDEYKEKNKERFRMLRHMIISHHGTLENGAIKPPATGEARALHDIDMFDSRYYTYEKESARLEEGSMSDRIWTLEAHVYHPTK